MPIGRELKDTMSLRQALAHCLPHCEMALMTFSAGSGCKGAAHITYGPVSMSTDVMAAVPKHAGCSRIAGQVRLGQPMPGSAIWKTSHGPDVLVCPHNRHAKTKSMPVMSPVSSHLPPLSSEARAFINNVCDGGETIGEESRDETKQRLI